MDGTLYLSPGTGRRGQDEYFRLISEGENSQGVDEEAYEAER